MCITSFDPAHLIYENGRKQKETSRDQLNAEAESVCL